METHYHYKVQSMIVNLQSELEQKWVCKDSSTSSESIQQAGEVYQRQFQKWMHYIGEYYDGNISAWPISHSYFHSTFLPNVQTKLRLKVVFDKKAVASLVNYAKKSNIIMFKYQPGFLYADISKVKEVFRQKKWIIVINIAELLLTEQFIPKSALEQISNLYSPDSSLQNRLNAFYENTPSNKYISLTTWNQKVGINCKTFWTSTIHQWPTLSRGSDTMKRVFLLFQGYLNQRLSKLQINRLKILFNLQKVQILQEIASILCLFSYPKKVKQMVNHLELFKHKITQYFIQSVKNKNIASFEIYGSFRSRICLESSDIDLTIFIQNENGVVCQNRQFICQSLWDTYSGLKYIATIENEQLNIDKSSIFSVINNNIKVPFLRFRFDSQMPINSMDVVVNNVNGVINSQVLQRYSQNIFIRNLGVLLKKWAKKNKLINPQRMSSYGLTLLMLYFLMCDQCLSFPTLDELTSLNFSIETKRKSLLNSLIGFLRFYQRHNKFHQDREIACIVKDCNDHHGIIDSNFVLNIHDPFDSTNPGRLKQRDQFLFFQSVDQTLQSLEEGKQLTGTDQNRIFHNLFGLEFQQIQEDV